MKPFFTISFFLFLSMISVGQIATTFDDAPGKGISMTHLDSLYMSDLDADSTKSVFYGLEEEYFNTWKKLLRVWPIF